MVEEKEEVKEKKPTEVEKAKVVVDAMKVENDRREELLVRWDASEAKKVINGTAEGGVEPEKPKEETDHDYRIRIQKEMASGRTEFGN